MIKKEFSSDIELVSYQSFLILYIIAEENCDLKQRVSLPILRFQYQMLIKRVDKENIFSC